LTIKQLLKILEYSYENLKLHSYSQTFRHQHYLKILCKYLWHPLLSALLITLYTNTLDDMTCYNMNQAKHLAIAVFTYKPVAHKCGTLPLNWHSFVTQKWPSAAIEICILCPNIWLGRSVLHFIFYLFSVLLTVLTEGWTKLHRSVSWFPLWPNEGWWDGWECDTFLERGDNKVMMRKF
jgi:hypothetical protein